jgi:ankyrin repeat protein
MLKKIISVLGLSLSVEATAQCDYADLISAIQTNNLPAVTQYIAQQCDVKPPTPTALSALNLALILDNTDIFKALVKADKALITQHGVNALAAACNINVKNKAAIELLIDAGVDINTMSANGFSCLYNAAVVPDIEFFNYLISKGARPSAKVVPDPIYKIDHLISVKDFIQLRLEAYKTLSQ